MAVALKIQNMKIFKNISFAFVGVFIFLMSITSCENQNKRPFI